jgi:tRNA(fMet)-specific endonuclease VapC
VTLALDTNVFIELLRGRRPLVRQRFRQAVAAGEALATSLIVLHELRMGCALHHDPVAESTRVLGILSGIVIEPLDEPDIVAAAYLRAALLRRGQPIGPLDGLIAGQALARDWTVVTANRREFDRIQGLNVIDWTLAAD